MSDHQHDKLCSTGDMYCPDQTGARRAEAAANPTVWRQGGSKDTEGCTMWQGNRFIGSTRYDADSAFLMLAANEFQRCRTAQQAAEAENERLRSLVADIPKWLAAEVHHAIDNEHQLVGGGIFRDIPEGGEIVPGVRASNIDAVLDRAHRDPRMSSSPDLVEKFTRNWFGPSPDGHVDTIHWAGQDQEAEETRVAETNAAADPAELDDHQEVDHD